MKWVGGWVGGEVGEWVGGMIKESRKGGKEGELKGRRTKTFHQTAQLENMVCCVYSSAANQGRLGCK